jgi:hypothetical protein
MIKIDYDMDAATYHGDPCDVPSLSASIGHLMVSKSPAHAYAFHPKLGGHVREATDAMDLGSLGHAKFIGLEDDRIVVAADEEGQPYRDFRKKAAQQLRDELVEQGKIVVLHKQIVTINRAVDRWKKRFLEDFDAPIEITGKPEVSLFWEETASDGTIVQCRGRVDLLDIVGGYAQIDDHKTCASAHPKPVQRHVHEYGYDIQRAAYVSAIGKIHPELLGRINYRWLFTETSQPYVVQDYVAAGTMRTVGEVKWRQAIDLWAMCCQRDRWPGYSEKTIRLEANRWELEQQFEAFGEDEDVAA